MKPDDIKAPCPICSRIMVRTQEVYWCCTEMHGRMIHKRQAEELHWAELERKHKAWLESPEGQAWKAADKLRNERRVAQKAARQRKKAEAVALPALFATRIQGLFRLEGQDGIYRKCGPRHRKAIHGLYIHFARTMWVRPLSKEEIDVEITYALSGKTPTSGKHGDTPSPIDPDDIPF